MKFILIAVALAVAAFFIAKKLKAKKEEVVAPAKKVTPKAPAKKVTPKAPAKKKTNTVKPAGGASLSESDSEGNDYYRKPRKAQK